MLRVMFFVVFVIFGSGIPASAEGKRTYTPGFKGTLSQFTVPLEAEKPVDQYLELKITFEEKPKEKSTTYDIAFHAVCQFHQGDLLRAARKLSPYSDWRVKVTFFWPVSSSDGITMLFGEYKFMWISNCRLV